MNPHDDDAPQHPGGRAPGKPGRKLGPIADGVGSAHRAWLEPLREKFLSSGMTISELHTRTGWAKSKISELLRGTGLYPRWEITQSLVQELRIPTWPMRRLWASAALEAQKKQDWIDRCIERPTAVSTSPDVPPIDHQAFKELQSEFYESYADVFLCNSPLTKRVIDDAFDVLELRWEEALSSSDVVRFAWSVLRSSVMARAPHVDGRPDLGAAVFDTVALERAVSDEEKFAQLEESSALFKVLSRLPDQQLDVMVLRHLRGMPPSMVADVLGVPIASVRSDERHALHVVEAVLGTESDPEGNAL
ncbi:sigma-70 family RNA polymerase sigma factor [Streptomyces sp. NPDC015350]|uniref:sigma-70 family RNA polymerase sigma factor n=1 Tax=Streptomyces sp. NPDC015350 TaxID=3364955 RepID=UPI0036F83574